MKSPLLKNLLVFGLLVTQLQNKAQVAYAIVNLDTVTYHGYTDTVDYAPILINSNGNVVFSGNQKMSATQYDATTASQISNGITVWANSFNPGSQKAYITASTNDASGNVYVVGGVRSGTATGVDFLVIKYDSNGNILWTNTYNGPNSTTDFATSVVVDDNNGSVFVTGASEGTLVCLMDYATLCYDASGTQQWCTRYNYNNSMDIPTSIEINPSTGRITVTGSSGTTFTDWDFATVIYNPSNGGQVSVNRTTNNNNAQDKVFSMASDTLGNVYIVGTVFNGSDYDLQLTKLDTALTVLWTQTYDGHGFDDAGINLAIDNNLNIIAVGTSHSANTDKELLVLKYNSSGTLLWRGHTQKSANINSEAIRVKVKSNNEIYVGGNIVKNSNQDLILLRFNQDGLVTMEKTYNGPANGKDQFMDFDFENNRIYVSARTYSAGVDYNIVLNYSFRDKTIIPDTIPSTGVPFVSRDVIIDFHKSTINLSTINNTDLLFGDLNKFVQDSTCEKLKDLLDPMDEYRIDWGKLKTQKIFPKMTTSDTVSISRLGTDVVIPPFYTKLLVAIPSQINTIHASNFIKMIKPDIHDSQLNYLYEPNWVPNDSKYALDQSSLHPTTSYSFAHINCEPAWDYTKGSSFVRVGVYDTGVSDNFHPDFGNCIVDDAGYSGSSVSVADYYGHGTKVAGTIAAKSNNSLGVSGIAGGDAAATGTANTGVSIVNMKIFEPQPAGLGLAPTNVLMNSYYDGANSTNILNGKGLHIMNHSYGNIGLAVDSALSEGINYVNKNGVAFIVSRGNKTPLNPWTLNAFSAPATMKKDKVMNIGASGTDGEYHKININGSNYSSMYAKNLDFVAPGAHANITTIQSSFNPSTAIVPPTYTYTTFGGTSASAPHVSGVSALMMSYRNLPSSNWNNIVHEDCENLLRRTASDLTLAANYFQAVGYDTISGWGRINAGSALAALQPQYKIRHIDTSHFITSKTISTTTISTATFDWYGLPTSTVQPGTYNVTMLKVTTVYNYNFSGETFIDAWPLFMVSAGCPTISPLTPPVLGFKTDELSYVELNAATISSATLSTYIYKINYNLNNINSPIQNTYIPYHLSKVNSAFTLYSLDPLVGIGENEANIDYFNVYPNPSNGNFTLGFYSKRETKANIAVYDLMGRQVFQKQKENVKYGLNRYNLELGHLPSGIYLLNLEVESNKTMVKKLIIE